MKTIIEESLSFDINYQKQIAVDKNRSNQGDNISTLTVILNALTEDYEEITIGKMVLLCVPNASMTPDIMKKYSEECKNISKEIEKIGIPKEVYVVVDRIAIERDFRYCGYGTLMLNSISDIVNNLQLPNDLTIALVASAYERIENDDYEYRTQKLCHFYEKMGFVCVNNATRVFTK